MTGIVASADILIAAPAERVWRALTDPAEVREWMFGTTLESDWRPGSPITWSGEFRGRAYQDRGEVLRFDAPHELAVTHFSPLTGEPDVPENYHTLTYRLLAEGDSTRVWLAQDNNADEDAAAHSRANWEQALQALKAHVERG